MSVIIPDVSEYQQFPQGMNAVRAEAIIIRLSQGTSLDMRGRGYRDAARAAPQFKAIGWYHYLRADLPPEPQAQVFCREIGALRSNEFIDCDDEEGEGDQSPRVNAFLATCDALLSRPSADFIYSGQYFFTQHLGAVRPDVKRWIAAYSATAPGIGEILWQYTSGGHCDGISDPVDLSIYNGTIQQFLALIGATTTIGGISDMGRLVITDGPDQHPGGLHGAIYCENLIHARWVSSQAEVDSLVASGIAPPVPLAQYALDRQHPVDPVGLQGADIVPEEVHLLMILETHLNVIDSHVGSGKALTPEQATQLSGISSTVARLTSTGGLTAQQAGQLTEIQGRVDKHLAA
jgi:GH25 family lysozyme M1 (1,4-beta-N-acetylmuramidase)